LRRDIIQHPWDNLRTDLRAGFWNVDVNFGFPPAQHIGKIQHLFFDCTQVTGKLLVLCVTDVVSVVEI
jgi:hypothetical protein